MNLLGNTGTKTTIPEKNIKETLLNEQICRLREIYQDASQALEKVITTLKKMMNYQQNEDQKSDVETLNNFLEDLSSIEDSFISLIENAESDRELYSSSVMFRDSEKTIETIFFKKMMKSHEDFKQKLNNVILRLQRDIQLLQANGYHIYDSNIKPNNVLNTLKKTTLDKYIQSRSEVQAIFERMKQEMSSKVPTDKRSLKTVFKNDLQRYKELYKNISQINLKEKLVNAMLVEEIHSVRSKIENQKKKLRIIEESVKINKRATAIFETEMRIYQGEGVRREEFKSFAYSLKEKMDSIYILTPQLYRPPKRRSKSCYPIITSTFIKQQKSLEKHYSLLQSEQSSLLGCDFLQNSVEQ